jgi:GNAT superfamily N-acetyltransferase
LSFVFATADLNTVRRLRDAVLRPGFARGGSIYPGDDEPDTLHVGAFLAGEAVAVASICREAPPGENDPAAWRLRGMATSPEHRGQGAATRLLSRCVAHARTLGGRRVWCSARVTVAEFYRRHGFVAVGEPFTLPQYSDERYIRMDCALAAA